MHESARNIRRIGHSDLNGFGDGMQLMLKDHYLFVGHVDGKIGTTILDVADPTAPRVVDQLPLPPNVHSHKVQIAGDLLLVNYEHHPKTAPPAARVGVRLLDISEPARPRELGFFDTDGRGVHRIWYTGGDRMYMSARAADYRERILLIADISDPTQPRQIGHWAYPGMVRASAAAPWPAGAQPWGVHHPVVHDDRIYAGFWGGGFVILDISDETAPALITHVPWAPAEGGSTHTAMPLPGRDLLVIVDESNAPNCQEVRRYVHLFDISDETAPRRLGILPEPKGDFCDRGGRFGPHNVHEHRPGAFHSENLLFVTYFNAGLRVYDISDATAPREVAHYIPPAPRGYVQTNDVYVAADGLIYISDRVAGGVDILTLDWQAIGHPAPA